MAGAAVRALIVEDEPLVRFMAADDLRELGLDVEAVSDGHDALALLSADREFGLLFTDIRMPGTIDGWELARQARKIIPGIAVVYASGYSAEQFDPVDGGVFIKKPYRLEEVRQAIQEVGVG